MSAVNSILTRLFQAVMWPFMVLGSSWGLFVFSALAGVVLLWLWGKTSNQTAIKAAKDKLKAHLLEIRIYNEDLTLVTRAMGSLFKSLGRYQLLMFRPLAIVLVPVLLILIQLNFRFGYAPPGPDQPLIAKVVFERNTPRESLDVTLEAPDGVRVETPGVRITRNADGLPEVAWRLSLERPGDYTLHFHLPNGETVDKSLVATEEAPAISPRRPGTGFFDQLLYPIEKAVPGPSHIEGIEISYAAASVPLLGIEWNWVILFLVVSMVSGFALKGVLKVEI